MLAGAALALLAVGSINSTPPAGGQAVPTTPSSINGGPTGRMALTGGWTFRLDPNEFGEFKGYQTGAFTGGAVDVPHGANPAPVVGRRGLLSFRGSVGWYRNTFSVPADGDYALRFESVHHEAVVWLNGKRLGRHVGAYIPFEYRVPLQAGQPQTLVVRADWRGPTMQKRTGWHRTWFNFGGINREVSIRRIGKSELTVPTVHTRLADGQAQVDVSIHVRNRASIEREVPVEGTLAGGSGQHALRFPTLVLKPGQTRIVHAQVTVPQPQLWSPESPTLYQLDLRVPDEAGYSTRVGLRQLTWKGSRLFLNGRALKLHGASIHEDVRGRGDALQPGDMDALVASLQAIGANATRSQHPLNPALLERFDAAGILVWLGVGPIDAPGNWTSKTPRLQRQARRRVRQSFFQAQSHPSLVAWNLANEVAGNGHPGGQARYVDDMARELHRRDPGRLVAVDVWGAHPPRRGLGFLYRNVDAIAVTNYMGWYERPLAPRDVIVNSIRARTRNFGRYFPGKVLVISEFGAEGNRHNPLARPGGFAYQAWLLEQHIRAYRAFPQLSGMLVWNLRDFAVSPDFAGGSIRKVVPGIKIVRGVNQKGIFDFDGKPKPAVDAVRNAFAPLGRGLG